MYARHSDRMNGVEAEREQHRVRERERDRQKEAENLFMQRVPRILDEYYALGKYDTHSDPAACTLLTQKS